MTYDTYDIGIAATFVVIGIELCAMEREAPSPKYRRGRVVFRFNDPEKAKSTLNAYLCDKLQVNPQKLITKMNEYRRIIYNKEALPTAS